MAVNTRIPGQVGRLGDLIGSVRRAGQTSRFVGVLALLVVMFGFFAVTEGTFLSSGNINQLLTSMAIIFLVSIGMTFVMLSEGFDLSVGATVAFTGIAFGQLFDAAGLTLVPAALCAVAAGTAVGILNGVLIGRSGLSFLVVTLGTSVLIQGVLNLWSEAKTISVTSPTLDTLAFGKLFGIPIPVWIMALVYAGSLYVLRKTYFGRDVYAVGGNADAARLSGIKVVRTIVAVYVIAAFLAALAGILQVARVGAASPLVGATLVFDAAAAVLLGGTSLAGGIGGVTGTMVGVLFLGVLQNGLSVSGVESYWQQVVTGIILIIVVAADRAQREGWSSIGIPLHRRSRRTHDKEPAS